MAEIIYVLTVLFFAYVINVVLGDEIAIYIKITFPKQGLILPPIPELSTSSLKSIGVYFNRQLADFNAKTNHR